MTNDWTGTDHHWSNFGYLTFFCNNFTLPKVMHNGLKLEQKTFYEHFLLLLHLQ